jgi:regulator of replication initiation timing
MSETATQLKRIQDKLQQLLKQHVALQKENNQLKEELTQTKELALTQRQHIDNLKQQMDVLKLHAGDMSEADKKELEKRINGYLKEIDRCIAMLGE